MEGDRRPSREERLQVARRRVRNVLSAHTVASMRTLEQKISDAGPAPQRVDPHLLTIAIQHLVRTGSVSATEEAGTRLYFLAETSTGAVRSRLDELLPIYRAVSAHDFTMRLGQTLEIAIYKGLLSGDRLAFFGAFLDLDRHGDERLYRKEEPPAGIGGRRIPDTGDSISCTATRRPGLPGSRRRTCVPGCTLTGPKSGNCCASASTSTRCRS